jgi:hypothetical protein
MIKGHITMTVSPDYARRELIEELLNNGEAIVRLKNIGENDVVSFELLPDIVYCKDCINFLNEHLSEVNE